MTTGSRPHGRRTQASTTTRVTTTAVLRRRRHFAEHLTVYVAGNLLLILVWLVAGLTNGTWFVWPVFGLIGWGLLLYLHAWYAYGRPSRPGGRPDP